MTLQAMRAFLAAAETGNFTRAAQRCFITQPAFSRMMTNLEEELGVKLFERTTRRVSLTSEGQIYLRGVTEMMRAYDAMMEEIEWQKEKNRIHYSVGYNPVSGPPEFLVTALKMLQEKHRNLHVKMVRAYSPDLVQRLQEGKLDCALVSGYYIDEGSILKSKPLQPISLFALAKRGSLIGEKDELNAEDLSTQSLLFMKNTAPLTRNTVHNLFVSRGLRFREVDPVEDLEEMIMRVRVGDIVGITSFCDPNGLYPDIVAIRIKEYSAPVRGKCRVLAWKPDLRNEITESLIDILDALSAERGSRGDYLFD